MSGNRDLLDLKTKQGAIVVSTGGHLEQALRRVSQLELNGHLTFFTPRSSQSESKLLGFRVDFIHNVGSRDFFGGLRAFLQLLLRLKRSEFDFVLSTGAGVAIAAFFVCRIKKIDFYYIESIARQTQPSLTGKVLEKLRADNLYTESKNFGTNRWRKVDSIFSNYQIHVNELAKNEQESLKIFVTVGTVHKFPFNRILELVSSVLKEGDIVVWQTGQIQSANLPGMFHVEMSDSVFMENLKSADVVISHAGVGSILNILDSGKCPILIPRLLKFYEHIDDHQLQIASVVAQYGLAMVVTKDLTREDFAFALRRTLVNPSSA